MPAFVSRIVVVDDASSDETSREVLGVGDARVSLVRHDDNRGVGAAIATGYSHLLASDGDSRDAFVVMAGDGQMDPLDLPPLVAPIVEGHADYVKGNRFLHPTRAQVMPRARYWGGVVLSKLTSKAIGFSVTDTQCGYTAVSRRACEKLDLHNLWPRYGYPNDLLSQLQRSHARVCEVRVRPVYEGAPSGISARHLPRIAWLIGRAFLLREAPVKPTRVRVGVHGPGQNKAPIFLV